MIGKILLGLKCGVVPYDLGTSKHIFDFLAEDGSEPNHEDLMVPVHRLSTEIETSRP